MDIINLNSFEEFNNKFSQFEPDTRYFFRGVKPFAVYILTKKEGILYDMPSDNPFEITEVKLISIPHVTNRIKNQFGYFTIQPNPKETLDTFLSPSRVKKVVFNDCELKIEFRKKLNALWNKCKHCIS